MPDSTPDPAMPDSPRGPALPGSTPDPTPRPSRPPIPRRVLQFIAGEFRPSESGRYQDMVLANGECAATVALGSPGDISAAVRAASGAATGWAGLAGHQRGEALYRVAELLANPHPQPPIDSDAAADLWLWYTGWADKTDQAYGLAGRAGPVGRPGPLDWPHASLPSPVPLGVIAAVVPCELGLIGLVDAIAPGLVAGNAVVALVDHQQPLAAAALAGILATAGLPRGVVNLVVGRTGELAETLATDPGVAAVDLSGINDPEFALRLEAAAMIKFKRLLRWSTAALTPAAGRPTSPSPAARVDRIAAALKTKTVSSSIGF